MRRMFRRKAIGGGGIFAENIFHQQVVITGSVGKTREIGLKANQCETEILLLKTQPCRHLSNPTHALEQKVEVPVLMKYHWPPCRKIVSRAGISESGKNPVELNVAISHT